MSHTGGSDSITSSRSFAARLLHAERWRLGLMFGCVGTLLALWVLRRLVHGSVASADAVFWPAVALLAVAVIALGLAFWDTRRRERQGRPLPWWRLIAGAGLDLGVPFGLLLILHVNSPRGAYAALSAPSLLVAPIVIMLSVLRLRPWFTFLLGLAAAAMHAALAAATIADGLVPADAHPVVYSYGVLLLLTGVAGAVLAVFVRRYIHEAVREAEAAERAARDLAVVSRELDIAREIQQGLLPSRSPDFAGWDIAGMARPAAQAGGDYYDWQPLPDGRLAVVIADVTGHGIGPALVMAVCRAYSRATVPRIATAVELIEQINDLVSTDLSNGRFITMAVAVLEPSGAVELLSAGHGPLFLYRAASRAVERFGGAGLPLGISAGERYDPAIRLRLEPGDALVLLTDGFMEYVGVDGELFGAQRLAEVIAANGSRPAVAIIEALDAAVTGFARGALQKDDMTAVVIRRI